MYYDTHYTDTDHRSLEKQTNKKHIESHCICEDQFLKIYGEMFLKNSHI